MRCVFMCAVLAGCGTIPRYAKFASGEPAPAGEVAVMPIVCHESEPARWGDVPKPPDDPAYHPCTSDVVSSVQRAVEADLAASGRRVVAANQRASTVVRVELASWRPLTSALIAFEQTPAPGARATIVVSTASNAFARVATCELEIYSRAAGQAIEDDVPATMKNAAACALRELHTPTKGTP